MKLKDILANEFEQARKDRSNFYYSHFTFENHPYAIIIQKDDKTAHCWYQNGTYSLCEVDASNEEAAIKEIAEHILDHANGFVRCCGCNDLIKKKDIAGNIFAGIYCKSCWEGKYKAQEALINYD